MLDKSPSPPLSEKKRRIYDQYGQAGLDATVAGGGGGMPGAPGGVPGGFFRGGRGGGLFGDDDFAFAFGGGPGMGGVGAGAAHPHFVFRDPFDVFREFFGGRDPFEDMLDRESSVVFVSRSPSN